MIVELNFHPPFLLENLMDEKKQIICQKNKNAGLFAFVIKGAFEMEGRLPHARDGWALWDTGAAEMKALSNDAIILVIELPDVSSS
ncbi:MAG: hypothetical protein ABIR15_06605 [Chitinophagaceae bacterium]